MPLSTADTCARIAARCGGQDDRQVVGRQPLFDRLHDAGWGPARKGFLGRLSSR